METTGLPAVGTMKSLIDSMAKGLIEASNANTDQTEEKTEKMGLKAIPNSWFGEIVVTGAANGFILRKGDGTNVIANNSGEIAAFFVNNREQLKNFLSNYNKDVLLDVLGIKTGAPMIAAKKKKGKKNAY